MKAKDGGDRPLEDNTEALIKRAISGSRQAAADLAVKYGPEVYRLARYLLHSEEEARDAAADIFVRLFADPEIIPPDGFRAWLMRVAYNHCLDLLRRRRTLNRLLPKIYHRTTEQPEPGPEQAAAEAEEQTEVRRAVVQLPEQERAIVVLRYYQQLSYAEISTVLDIPENTVGTRLHRAREKLRKLLSQNEGGVKGDAVPRKI